MNQIYNLAQTITADKDTITKLEKHLLNAKNILAAHENAMERLTTVPSVIASEKGNGVARGAVRGGNTVRVRITYPNSESLNIKIGDKVDVVINGDPDTDFRGVYDITDVNSEEPCYPFYLEREYNGGWYEFKEEEDESELYLIRTPEGSLYKQ